MGKKLEKGAAKRCEQRKGTKALNLIAVELAFTFSVRSSSLLLLPSSIHLRTAFLFLTLSLYSGSFFLNFLLFFFLPSPHFNHRSFFFSFIFFCAPLFALKLRNFGSVTPLCYWVVPWFARISNISLLFLFGFLQPYVIMKIKTNLSFFSVCSSHCWWLLSVLV